VPFAVPKYAVNTAFFFQDSNLQLHLANSIITLSEEEKENMKEKKNALLALANRTELVRGSSCLESNSDLPLILYEL